MSDRDTAAGIFDGAAIIGEGIAKTSGDSGVKLAAGIGAGLARMVAAIIRSTGVENAKKLIAALHDKINEGVITSPDIKADDAAVREAIDELYAEHLADNPADPEPNDGST